MPTWASGCAVRPNWTASATASPNRTFLSWLLRAVPSVSSRATRPCGAMSGTIACARGSR
eukprot:9441466-Lingulodinium_polyedra.AAC.1